MTPESSPRSRHRIWLRKLRAPLLAALVVVLLMVPLVTLGYRIRSALGLRVDVVMTGILAMACLVGPWLAWVYRQLGGTRWVVTLTALLSAAAVAIVAVSGFRLFGGSSGGTPPLEAAWVAAVAWSIAVPYAALVALPRFEHRLLVVLKWGTIAFSLAVAADVTTGAVGSVVATGSAATNWILMTGLLGLCLSLLLGLGTILVMAFAAMRPDATPTTCPRCGYELRGLESRPPRCPECGEAFVRRPPPTPTQRRLAVRGALAATLVSIAAILLAFVLINYVSDDRFETNFGYGVVFYASIGAVVGCLLTWSRSPSEEAEPERRRLRLVRRGAVATLIAAGLMIPVFIARDLRERASLAAIERDITAELAAHLRASRPGDDIFDRYGAFKRITATSVRRPGYAWQLVERIDFNATAEFDVAEAGVYLGVNAGPAPAITRLELTPSPDWRASHPQQAGELRIIDGEMWLVHPHGRTRCSIDGWAVHPDY